MKAIALIIFLGLSLSGCSHSTIENIKDDPSLTHTQVINDNYQAVYRHLSNMYRRCLSGGPMIIENDLYNDIKRGDIGLVHYAFNGRATYIATEIIFISDNSSEVITRAGAWGWKRRVPEVAKWATGYDKCD